MKIRNGLLLAGLAMASLPQLALAQDKGDKKKDTRHIQIFTTTEKNEKLNIVVDGDKVTVNGKDVKDQNDVRVNVVEFSGDRLMVGTPGQMRAISFSGAGENTAFLGVQTAKDAAGVKLEAVTENSAAAKAGLKAGDILTKIDKADISEPDDVTKAVRAHKPGDKISINYTRDGKKQTASAELGKHVGAINFTVPPIPPMPSIDVQRLNGQGNVYFRSRTPRLGMKIQELEDGPGVKVIDVDADGAADKSGFKKDDVIVGIDDHEVTSAESFVSNISSLETKSSYTVRVKRGNKTENLTLKIPKKVRTMDL